MISVLEQLKLMTNVVADTGSIEAIARLKPSDCTTNPSLVLQAMKDPASKKLIDREVLNGRQKGKTAAVITDTITVALGAALADLVTGRVSTEVDANLSFDVDASVQRGQEIVSDYAERGVGVDRILVKLAATWEGIEAAKILQRKGIDCNLTLVFSLSQAIADAGAFLISPFVGRITDWHKNMSGVNAYSPEQDPGVSSVKRIYDYYKSNHIDTIVMGASFRNIEQIKALGGCDNLTIAPGLLDELANDYTDLVRSLSPNNFTKLPPQTLSEATFRWNMNADAMANDKLAEGIRSFDADHTRLADMILTLMKKN
jgi:transaldolase